MITDQMEHGEGVFIWLIVSSPSSKSTVRTRTQRRSSRQGPTGKNCYKDHEQTPLNWLASSCLCLAQLSYITWDYLPNGGTTHSGLGPADMPIHQSDGGNSLIKVLYSQVCQGDSKD